GAAARDVEVNWVAGANVPGLAVFRAEVPPALQGDPWQRASGIFDGRSVELDVRLARDRVMRAWGYGPRRSVGAAQVARVMGARRTESVALSVSVGRTPEVRDAILAGIFQRFPCACGLTLVAEGPLVYLDFDERRFVGVFPRDGEPACQALEREAEGAFRRNL